MSSIGTYWHLADIDAHAATGAVAGGAGTSVLAMSDGVVMSWEPSSVGSPAHAASQETQSSASLRLCYSVDATLLVGRGYYGSD